MLFHLFLSRLSSQVDEDKEALWDNHTSLLGWEGKGDPVCVSDDEDPPAVTTSAMTETN